MNVNDQNNLLFAFKVANEKGYFRKTYTLEYKLPRQRKWRIGYSMKDKSAVEASLPEWLAFKAVDSLCLSSQIKTRII